MAEAKIIYASPDDKQAIENLLQLYIYDFTEWVDFDVMQNGLYKLHLNLEDYWTEDGKYPYLISNGTSYAGFVLVKTGWLPAKRFSIAEFFILKKYRRQGIGADAAKKIFDLHPGEWEVHQTEKNLAAQKFWINVIDKYSNGQYADHFANRKRIQVFNNEKKQTGS